MPAHNPHRGEVPVRLRVGEGWRDFVLRPTWQAAAEVESELGTGLIGILDRYRARQFGLRETAAIVGAGLRAAGEPAKPSAVAEMVFRTGIGETAEAAIALLVNMITGGKEPDEGEDQAGAGPTGSTSAVSPARPRRSA